MSTQALTLVQKAVKGNAAPKPAKRVLKQRDTDEAATRAMKDHFPKFSALDTDVRLVNGATLRERLSRPFVTAV